MKKLVNFTQMPKDAPFFIKNKNAFIYPFDRAISRTSYKADHFNYELASESILELVNLKNQNLSWSECCILRARELLALNKKNYYICFSGGIDSTGIMVAILQTWSKEDLSRIKLVLTSHSIEENSEFFFKYLSKFEWVNYLNGFNFLATDSDSIIITGANGDQLLGSDIFFSACDKYGDSILHKNYKDFAPKIYSLWNRQNAKVDIDGVYLFEHFHPIVDECPFKIKTVFEYFWWINFTQKWQHIKFKHLEARESSLDLKYNQNIVHFFDTIYFQHWSMSNPDLKIGNSLDSYKMEAKKFIFSFTKNNNDLKLNKQHSIQKTYLFTENRIAIDSDYKEVASMDELEKYARK